MPPGRCCFLPIESSDSRYWTPLLVSTKKIDHQGAIEMNTDFRFRWAAKLIPLAAALTLATVMGCNPVVQTTPPSTKPDSQYFAGTETASGDVYATGYQNIAVGVDNYYTSVLVLRKFDKNQKLLWERQYPDPTKSEYLTAMSASLPTDNAGKFIQVASDGSVYVAAELQQPANYGVGHSKVDYDIALLKYSADGSLQWIRYVDLRTKDFPRGLQIGPDGNIYLQGRTIKFTTPSIEEVAPSIDFYNDFIASFNSNGGVRWRVNFNKPGENATASMQFRSDGIYLAESAGFDSCDSLYKIDYAGYLTTVLSSSQPGCSNFSHEILVGNRVILTPVTTGSSTSTIVSLSNPNSIETTIAWQDIAVSYLHADNTGYTYTELWQELPDRLQPNAFFALLSGTYHFIDADGEERNFVNATLLVHATTDGDVLAIVPMTDDKITSAYLRGGLKLAQKASGDVVVSVYIEDMEFLRADSNIHLIDYNSHTVTDYPFASGNWLSSITGLESGQTPLVVGSRYVNDIWTPSIRQFDQGQ